MLLPDKTHFENEAISVKCFKHGDNITCHRAEHSLASVQDWLSVQAPITATTSKAKSFERYGHIDYLHASNQDDWTGGSSEKLKKEASGNIDISKHQEALERLRQKGDLQAIQSTLAPLKPRKQRIFSEYDGDYQLDRRWETEPFLGQRKIENGTLSRSLTLIINSSINAVISADEFRKFGVLCWAIAATLETSGVSTRIISRFASRDVFEGKRHNALCIDVIVKEFGQGFNPHQLAFVLQSNFFQRAIFELRVRHGSNLGWVVDPGIGNSIRFAPVESQPGILTISPEVSNNPSGQQEILNHILKTLLPNA